MATLGGPDRSPELRVSDRERQWTVDVLRKHTAEGRLELDEFSDRVTGAYAARTKAELEALTADLPVAAPVPVGPAAPKRRVSRVIAFMSGNRRSGRWRPGQQVRSVAFMGGCLLDLRDADFEGDELTIWALSFMGGIHIIVPGGMRVEFSGVPLMGGTDCKVPDPGGAPVGPVLRVKAVAFMGGVHVRAKPPKGPAGHSRPHDQGRSQRQERRLRRHRGQVNGSAGSEAPAAMPVGSGTVTVMFTDVVGFTELTERLGDERARELLRHHAAVIRAEVAGHGGREGKDTGDGFLVVFPSARQAVRCAAAIQRSLLRSDGALPIRIGLNSGDALHDDGDVMGFTVNVAARIADAAGPGEILVSAVTRELAGAVADLHFGAGRSLRLHGVTGDCHVHPVDWAADTV